MTVGSTINYSVPVVGTTVETFDRSTANAFRVDYTQAGGTYPAVLTIRPAGEPSTLKRFGVTGKVRPADFDDPGSLTKGGCTVNINIDAVPGSVMTRAEIIEFTRYIFSTALHANLIENLYDGITE
jgi:hypothetical protein